MKKYDIVLNFKYHKNYENLEKLYLNHDKMVLWNYMFLEIECNAPH